MIITRTPLRCSLAGGGSDLPHSIQSIGEGLVVGAALARYVYVSVRILPPFHPYRYRAVYSKTDEVGEIKDFSHPVIRACCQHVLTGNSLQHGLEITHQSDMPGRSGVGSSSSFTVGLLNALHCFKGQYLSPLELAAEATHIERDVLGESVGYQDQVWASYGGVNTIRFRHDGDEGADVFVEPLGLSPGRLHELEQHLLILHTGHARFSSEVSSTYSGSLGDNPRRQLSLLKMAEEAKGALLIGDLRELATIMDRSWRLKMSLSDAVAPTSVQEVYAKARAYGAWGGKLMGAGGGGCFLLVAPPDKHEEIIRGLGLINIPVKFDHEGSKVIFADRSGPWLI